jgi:2-polyprenyl-6-methoxyphenol hydroxylase-like FAD-dependent oxidoreductase
MHPTGVWAAFCSLKSDLVQGSKVGQAYCAPGGRFMAVATDEQGMNRVTFMGVSPRNDSSATQLFRQAADKGDGALRQFVAQQYRHAGWKCDEAVAGMLDADDFYANESSQVKVPHLYKGRFVMVGDAGYAPGPTGTGTSLALAGAYILAGEVHKNNENLKAALEGYEASMRPMIEDMQKVPPLMPLFVAPQTAWGIWLRNNVFGLITKSGIVNFVQKYAASAFAGPEKYTLPDYRW